MNGRHCWLEQNQAGNFCSSPITPLDTWPLTAEELAFEVAAEVFGLWFSPFARFKFWVFSEREWFIDIKFRLELFKYLLSGNLMT